NVFGFPNGGAFMGTRVWALNKAQMYAGEPSVQVVQFSPPSSEFTLLPANARLQEGTPPAGSPNYYSVVWQFTNGVSIYKFHVDWARPALSTFTGPFIALAPTSWGSPPSTVPAQGGNANDTLALRLMMQNQYTNLGGVESVWLTHSVLGGVASTAAPRYYQVGVTGGTVAANTTQAATHTPDTTVNRYMPSLAVDRAGDMALGYSASSAVLMPAIRYAGRLAGDPVNTLPQTETSLIEGTGAQSTSTRWGDYSAMSVAPDGCTFWFTSEYYIATGSNWQTRVGSFAFPSCTPSGSGTLQGTVTAQVGGAPVAGALVTFGSRTTTTNGSGVYSFTGIPSGIYPTESASSPGYVTASASNLTIADSATSVQNFALTKGPSNACLVDTLQADFQTGVGTNVDLAASPDDVLLLNAATINQQNTTLGSSGVGITITTWGGQTFTPSATGQLVSADINLFCSGCTGTTPNLTLSLRATSGGLPTGADLASGTIAGFSSGSSAYYSVTFASPPTVTSGTQYALVIRPTANPSPGTYALTRSGTSTAGADVYAGGTRVAGATSGTVWSIPLTGGVNTDAGFKVYLKTGFAASGDLASANKDSNPAPTGTPNWTTLSWTGTTPANTALKFQVAASASSTGPFNYVGPDNTAGTFFTTSGASLSQFNGSRYLKYRAYLSTTDSAATPTLSDVTTCYTTVFPPPDLSLTKSDGGASVAPGGTVAYTLTYSNVSGQDASGVVLSETVPANTAFNAGASTAGWSCTPNNNAGSTCTLAIGGVALGAQNSAIFAVTAVNPMAAGVTQIANTAGIADNGSHGADPTPANNTASDTTPITGAPDLSLSKSDGGVAVAPGGTV
ncbi:MAG TPA: carboxypeptidase regulatory-like domain-containing protein, partial [Flavobacteriales bacterium]|nr:carboxypeptidase regulatory-like domain-containing protein [Flavobacteriales bacterium]